MKLYADWVRQLEQFEHVEAQLVAYEKAVPIVDAFSPVIPALYAAMKNEIPELAKAAAALKKVFAKHEADTAIAGEVAEAIFAFDRAYGRFKALADAAQHEQERLSAAHPLLANSFAR